jgi:flagellar assembly factor FliW
MKIETIQFGEIEFTEDRIISFQSGPFGFENYQKFLLIKTDDDLFYWLYSIDEPEIAFPLVGVRLLDDSFPGEENHEPFGIITLNQDPLKITVNLQAPVYINQNEKNGYQKILNDDKYPVHYNLFVE